MKKLFAICLASVGLLYGLGSYIEDDIEMRAQGQQLEHFLNVELPQLYNL